MHSATTSGRRAALAHQTHQDQVSADEGALQHILCTIVFPPHKSFHAKKELWNIFSLSAAKPLNGWFVRRQTGIGRHSAAEVPAILPSSCRTSSDQHNHLWLS